VFAASPCLAQVTYCAVERSLVEQSVEWCQKRNAPYVSVSARDKLSEIETTKILQLQLFALGFDPAGIDGVAGPGTSNAIRQFQRSIGQSPDGAITAALRSQLDERTRSKPIAPNVQIQQATPNFAAGGPPAATPAASDKALPPKANQSGGSAIAPIVFVVILLAMFGWMLFKVVGFVVTFPRRWELRNRLKAISREDEAATVVGQMGDRDLLLSTGARRDCFSRLLATVMTGDTVTPNEAQHLKEIQGLLRLSDSDMGDVAGRVARAEALGRIDAGILPEVTNPPVNLQFGEKAYLAVGAQLLEERVVGRRYQGGSRGVSIRIMKGVSYRVGASSGTSVSVRGVVPVSVGNFCITSHRLVFSGNAKSFAFDRKKILSTKVHSDGITIAPDSGATRTIQFTESADPYVVQRLVNWVTSPMRIEA
jgi:peptidoglycan hydrolase-like protein with peptidoglycan-binding domain